MRRVLYSVGMSLDAYIAGPNGEFDWLYMDPAMNWKEFIERFDTVLIGRKTYEATLGHSGPGFPGMKTLVFSRTLRPSDHRKVTIRNDAAQEVARLKTDPGKDIWLMGGGELFRSLLEAGMVDGVEVGIVPILLGQGLPLLPPTPKRVQLALTEKHDYPSGLIGLSYSIVPEKAKRRGRARGATGSR